MKNVILHGHIFKNAGTTLDWALERSFGKGFVNYRGDGLRRGEGLANIRDILAKQPGLQAISSHHMPTDVSDDTDFHFHHVYLLRHPLLRSYHNPHPDANCKTYNRWIAFATVFCNGRETGL